MTTQTLTDDECQEALAAYERAGKVSARAADLIGLHRNTFINRLREAKRRFSKAHKTPKKIDEILVLKDKLRGLEGLLRQRQDDALSAEKIRTSIMKLTAQTPEPPEWLVKTHKSKAAPGVPTLMLSDLHWGEVVDPNQVDGVNSYDISIAQRRMRAVVNQTIDLLMNHMVNPSYPGMVLVLGGDLFSGRIHDELIASNEKDIMPSFVDLYGVLIWAIETLADTFGHLFIPCVSGNHGRDTKKIYAKGRNFTSFDWLLYCMLAKYFERDKRITFHIPDGADARYKIYGFRYLLNHGDGFSGGDGLIGVLGPVVRGDYKKRARNNQMGKDYDILIIGHFHQLVQLRKLIINGSLVGYNEYAYANNMPFEPPAQALWITHPTLGITFSMPVYPERCDQKKADTWISIPANKEVLQMRGRKIAA